MAQHNDRGNRGELLAKIYLEKKGYEVLDENWRYEKAEIDLIALFENKLIFIEVKTRATAFFGYPEEAVSSSKQELLKFGAEAFIEVTGFEGEIRFDIISIILDQNNRSSILHFEDAFF